MVISGGLEPSLERAAASSAVAANSQSVAEKATTATKPPMPLTPKPVTTTFEKPPPPVPTVPMAVDAPVQSTPAAVPAALTAAVVPPALPLGPPTSVLANTVIRPPAPIPVAPAAPPAVVPAEPSPPAFSAPQAASATTGGQVHFGAPLVVRQFAPASLPAAPMGQQLRPQSPDRRLSRPHSPAPHQERESSRRRRESPRRPRQQAYWPAQHGGRGGWWGPCGRGGCEAYDLSVRMADLQRCVQCDARGTGGAESQQFDAGRAGVCGSPSCCASLAGVEFVAAGGGAATAQYPPLVAGGQLFRLADSLHALLLIQVLAHSSLHAIPSESFHDRPRDVFLDVADQLALLLALVLAAPSEGGAAAAGQLDEAIRGLRRHLHAVSGAAAIGASTLVVRELWRTLTGVLHTLGAHRM
ncbi:unnamed protein product [Closterium sp. NIES-53]